MVNVISVIPPENHPYKMFFCSEGHRVLFPNHVVSDAIEDPGYREFFGIAMECLRRADTRISVCYGTMYENCSSEIKNYINRRKLGRGTMFTYVLRTYMCTPGGEIEEEYLVHSEKFRNGDSFMEANEMEMHFS